jgi:hypothetical protein
MTDRSADAKEKRMTSGTADSETWPALPLEAWRDTYATLHLWLQIVGKIRLSQSPWVNHSWGVTLRTTATGLTTGLIPHPVQEFQIDFDFVQHRLRLQTLDGRNSAIGLEPQPVATFYRRVLSELHGLGIDVKIHPRPNEMEPAIRFDADTAPRAYDPEYANRFWRVLVQADRVLHVFRARFIGKCSPVHLFWGAPDLAVTRFSGRRAPQHPGGIPNLPDWVAREAYSHEVSSAGFWPGGGPVPEAVFYSYAYPEPPGFPQAAVRPSQAYWHVDLREFLLPYTAVRESASPDATLLEFLQSTYDAAADLAHWDRAALERSGDPKHQPTP